MGKGKLGFWSAVGGAAIGAMLGVLLAPKKGSETRRDVAEWSRRNRDKVRNALSKAGQYIPERVSRRIEKAKELVNS